MKRHLVMLLSAGALFLGGCANDDLTVEDTSNRGPAPFSPDASSHLPTPPPDPILGGAGRY